MDSTLIKSKLKAFILCFVKGSEKKFHITRRLNNSISHEEHPTFIAKKLFDAIEKSKSPLKSINRVTDLDTRLSEVKVKVNIYKLHTAILELFYQQVLIARGVFPRHHMLTTKFVQMTC